MLYVDGRVYLAHEWEICDSRSIDLYYKVIEAGFVGEDNGMGIVATHGGAEKQGNTNVNAVSGIRMRLIRLVLAQQMGVHHEGLMGGVVSLEIGSALDALDHHIGRVGHGQAIVARGVHQGVGHLHGIVGIGHREVQVEVMAQRVAHRMQQDGLSPPLYMVTRLKVGIRRYGKGESAREG